MFFNNRVNRMRNVILLLCVSAFLTGCTTRKEIHYLTPQEAMKYPVVMIANCDITCGRSKILKGTIYIVKEVGGYKFKITSGSLLKNTALMLEKKTELPDDALLIKLQEDDKSGFIVYPNGQFVYDNYYYFGFDDFGKLYTNTNQKCTFNAKSPFILKDNR